MRPRLKCVAALIVAMAAWLVASPVWAAELSSPAPGNAGCAQNARNSGGRSAPLCDPRGATMFGPTPTLDSPDASIDVGNTGEDPTMRLLGFNAYEQGRTPTPLTSHAIPEAVLGGRGRVAQSPLVGLVLRYGAENQGLAGVRQLLERPPRFA